MTSKRKDAPEGDIIREQKVVTRQVKEDTLKITPLGGGSEVGRSCILLQFKGKQIMLDCGIHPAYTGLNALPYFDVVEDLAALDLVLVSHFHLDHCATLPYLLEKTPFAGSPGRVFMTHPTKAIYKMFLSDFVKVSNIADEQLYTEQDLLNSMDKIEVLDYHQEREVNGIKFTAYNAGHVLGAAMFLIEIAGTRILYTGDYSRQEDRHLMEAEIPPIQVDVLIVEATYGVQIHEPRAAREHRFTSLLSEICARGGRALLPVFALGRAQELLLILDEHWAAHPELQHVPIYFVSALAKKALTVYQTYLNMMNRHVRESFLSQRANPWVFRHITTLPRLEELDESGPCVVMCSPGMLQSGFSRQLFELWAPDPRNGVVLSGYCVEGTLAKTIQSEPDTVPALDGRSLPLRCTVDYISFSAHADFLQTSEFVELLRPPHVVLVHGDSNEMGRLKAALADKFGDKTTLHTPKNTVPVALAFTGEKVVKTVGELAAGGPEAKPLSGLLVRKEFALSLMKPADAHTYTTSLRATRLRQRQKLECSAELDALQEQLGDLFADIVLAPAGDCLTIAGAVTLRKLDRNGLEIAWDGSPVNDIIVHQLLLEQVGLRPEPRPEPASLAALLASQFGAQLSTTDTTAALSIDGATATLDLATNTLSASDPVLQAQLQAALARLLTALTPLSLPK